MKALISTIYQDDNSIHHDSQALLILKKWEVQFDKTGVQTVMICQKLKTRHLICIQLVLHSIFYVSLQLVSSLQRNTEWCRSVMYLASTAEQQLHNYNYMGIWSLKENSAHALKCNEKEERKGQTNMVSKLPVFSKVQEEITDWTNLSQDLSQN